MANYFSNHSNSRFLLNSTQVNALSSNSNPSRSRIPSKHFSTTLNTTSPTISSKDSSSTSSTPPSAAAPQVHPLRNTWVFWFRQQRAPGNKIISYEEGIKKISAFSSVESFWSLWTHLVPPSSLQPTTDYLLFHAGIKRPVWEDPLNLSGGKWIIRLKKGLADRLWEELVMAIIGDQFDNCRSSRVEDSAKQKSGNGSNKSEDGSENLAEWPEICGCTVSVRQSEDIITVWNRVDADVKVREQIRDTLRKVLNLPPSTVMEYKSNNDSMQDKSSFRRTNIDKAVSHS
ncbi:hypothetical protein CVT24_006267 [Panaeolus cyanescens]|uniref:Uncharacterized protein n=1 Tax=Panaeolus cyanescens TaxID=181874 RepID=A0A409VAL2_9AGAR|nr:hypothetical protein CVT24_006267 [Panaeolus cyanescens]